MQEVAGESARIQIMEREDYTLTLARTNEGKTEELHFYGVLVSSPFRTERVYVLADSEESAISQARYAAKMDDCDFAPTVAAQISTYVERLPYVIHGWLDHRF